MDAGQRQRPSGPAVTARTVAGPPARRAAAVATRPPAPGRGASPLPSPLRAPRVQRAGLSADAVRHSAGSWRQQPTGNAVSGPPAAGRPAGLQRRWPPAPVPGGGRGGGGPPARRRRRRRRPPAPGSSGGGRRAPASPAAVTPPRPLLGRFPRAIPRGVLLFPPAGRFPAPLPPPGTPPPTRWRHRRFATP